MYKTDILWKMVFGVICFASCGLLGIGGVWHFGSVFVWLDLGLAGLCYFGFDGLLILTLLV